MTVLVIAAQDIGKMDMGLVQDGVLVKQESADAPPERYLETLDDVLKMWNTSQADVNSVGIVVGPGSFTASRVSTTLGNALAFAWKLPVYALPNPTRLPLPELIASTDWSPANQQPFAVPVYDRPPHITAPARGDNPLDEPKGKW